METYICEINNDNILSFEPYILDEDIIRIRDSEAKALGIVTDDNRSCGALIYRMDEKESLAFLEFVCVDQNIQRKKIGIKLVESFLKLDEVLNARDIIAYIPPEKQEVLRAFLTTAGFDYFVDGEWFFEIDRKILTKWFIERIGLRFRKSFKIDKYSINKVSMLTSAIRGRLPKVSYDADFSFVIDQNPKNGYILAQLTDNNNILVKRIYLPKGKVKAGNAMLYKAFVFYKSAMRTDSKLYVTCFTDAQKEIWMKIFPSSPYSYMMYAHINNEQMRNVDNIISRSTFSVPRINTLCKMLEDGGYYYSVDYNELIDNTIMINRPKSKRPISITCTMIDNNAEYFNLEIASIFDYDSLTDQEKELFNDLRDNQGLAKVFLNEERNIVRMNINILEDEIMIDEEAFLSLLATFEKELDELKASEEPESVVLKQRLLEDE